jgi:uncharacterized protein
MRSLFKSKKVIIGMVHLKPMPGFPNYGGSMQEIIDFAIKDAKTLESGGVDGLIVENIFNRPRQKTVGPETVAPMSIIFKEVVNSVNLPVGIKVLFNDAKAELAIVNCCGGHFVRLSVYSDPMATMAGIIEGCAYEAVTFRKLIDGEKIKILADVHVKHAAPLANRPISDSAFDAANSGMADGLVVTGKRTGLATDIDDISAVKEVVPDKLLLVGSGTTVENVKDIMKYADGSIIGTYFKKGGDINNPVDLNRVQKMVEIVRGI